jgi:hypothetical protein
MYKEFKPSGTCSNADRTNILVLKPDMDLVEGLERLYQLPMPWTETNEWKFSQDANGLLVIDFISN